MTNGLVHHYHELGESTVILKDKRKKINKTLFNSSMEFFCANRIYPDATPHSVASHLGIYSMSMSHK